MSIIQYRSGASQAKVAEEYFWNCPGVADDFNFTAFSIDTSAHPWTWSFTVSQFTDDAATCDWTPKVTGAPEVVYSGVCVKAPSSNSHGAVIKFQPTGDSLGKIEPFSSDVAALQSAGPVVSRDPVTGIPRYPASKLLSGNPATLL